MKHDLKLVSCLMVTKNRPVLALRAVKSFLAQTYPLRELVIVDESDADWSGLIPTTPLVRFYHYPGGNGPLGRMRNESLKLAKGGVVMQWDDDDWSHPERIERQLSDLGPMHLGFLERLTLFWPTRQQVGLTPPRRWECSFIAKRARLPLVYPEWRKGEDSALFSSLIASCPHRLLEAPDLYVRTVHGANTWESDHFENFQQNANYVPLSNSVFETLMAATEFSEDMICNKTPMSSNS